MVSKPAHEMETLEKGSARSQGKEVVVIVIFVVVVLNAIVRFVAVVGLVAAAQHGQRSVHGRLDALAERLHE